MFFMKFLLAFHFLVTLALVGVILIQKSGDSALGIGGNTGGLLTPRGQANLLTKITGGLAILFFVNCIVMATISKPSGKSTSIIDKAAQEQVIDVPSKGGDASPSTKQVNNPQVPQ